MKFIMVAEGDQITQQLLSVDFPSTILNLYGAPVGLMGNQTVGFQQVADQRLFDCLFTAHGIFQIRSAELIVVDDDILIVDTGPIKVGYRLPFQFVKAVQRHADIALSAGAQIVFQRLAYRVPGIKTRLVKTVQVQLKAFRLNQIYAGVIQLHMTDRDLR